jgi:hypothetical protein
MWTLGPEERIIYWREFREHISTLSKEQAIQETAVLWSTAPISNQYLASDYNRDWPDPWDLLHYNHYDDMSITLGMVYTLALTADKFSDVIIKVMTTINNNTVYHTAWFDDGKYIMNYEYGKIVSSDALSYGTRTKYAYSYTELQIDKYK